ncbi:3-deoxy-D-manno-octulosonic acid kinase [Halomonas coralii]|uniref:3-deoxy-D-manno-octulosonic acid kinase n=1 Tax=Modicisalibacter sp. R2A 31.J TaxID=2831898 RepID=UPI001CC92DAD|nr:3-deoxy-D-manno-octulosonic acid kinase [Modicisalibacter sp. R2A 31.J]MBZ9558706.1 3-deoxy-D-manno-octulosonic acid kinase [Modicisalibacter sp. R2A 31.J]
MRLATFQMGKDFILHDAGILWDAERPPQISPAWFSSAFWKARDAIVGQAPGRGASLFIDATAVGVTDETWVLRPYRRGGQAARFSEDHYLWNGAERSRAFRELRLTATLHERGLPVPRPVAAWTHRHRISYRAALLTVKLPGARALADCLADADPALLERVGATIRRFHDAGLDHVDLNARNLLITPDERIWLIDLDRCRLRRPGGWRERNLKRLERSIGKFAFPREQYRASEIIRNGYKKN